MGFRSTFTTTDMPIEWPDWFVKKYGGSVVFQVRQDGTAHGGISAVHECKAYGIWEELPNDIWKCLVEYVESGNSDDSSMSIALVYLHECEGITFFRITRDGVSCAEPARWVQTRNVEHHYCDFCGEEAYLSSC